MGILHFDKPEKVKSKEEWAKQSFDGGPKGGFIPNMSAEDESKFKAKHIKGDHERVEIRVTIGGNNLVLKVYKDISHTKWEDNREEYYRNHNNLQWSANGKLDMTFEELADITQAIKEARKLIGC